MFQWGLKAAAFGLPFLPTRVGLGTDLAELGGLKTVQSPYADGEVLIAMPALKLDAALLHVNRSDWRGNVHIFGPDAYYDEWFARAAAKTYVSCEELVDRMEDTTLTRPSITSSNAPSFRASRTCPAAPTPRRCRPPMVGT